MIKKLLYTLLLWLGFLSSAISQLPSAELYSIDPPVIKAGTTSEVTLSGANLDESVELFFSDSAIEAKPILLPKTEYQLEARQSGLRFRVTTPKMSQEKTVSVRAAGVFGLSTSRPLTIVPETEVVLSDGAGAAHHKLSTAPELPLEATAHGTTDSRQTDWWKVQVKKGERLLVHCKAERIDSQADANLTLVDGRGYQLEGDRDSIGRDPMLDFTAPNDGTYWVGVHDVFFNGGVNFPYLLEITTRPWIDNVFPPAGKPGETFDATLTGRNLAGGSRGENLFIDGKPVETVNVKIEVPQSPTIAEFQSSDPSRALLSTFPYRYKDSNQIDIGLSDRPLLVSKNTDLSPPFEIASRFEDTAESEFRFVGKKGVGYYVEVVADRIAGDLDPYLIVEKITKDNDGKESFKTVKEGDDDANKGGATFDYSSRDVTLNFIADQDGEYRVSAINQYNSVGPGKIYRFAVREANPDFEIIAVAERQFLDARQAYPAAPLLRNGGRFPLRLVVNRKDGLKGDITVSASGLPAGVSCPPVTIPEKDTSVMLSFLADSNASDWSGKVDITATAKHEDKEILHRVSLATLVIGVADHSTGRLRGRLDFDVPLAVRVGEPTPARIEAGEGGKYTVTLGEKLEIPVKLLSKNELKGNLAITLVGLRGMSKPPTINIAEKDNEGKLTLDFTSKPNVFTPEVGTWNFILKGTGVTKYKRNFAAVDRAGAEKKHVDALVKKYTDEATKAKSEVGNAKKAMDLARQNLNTASVEVKPALEEALKAAKSAYETAEKTAKSAEAKRDESVKEQTAATRRVAEITKLAAVKDVKFASWSQPLTVEVKAVPKPEEKAKKE